MTGLSLWCVATEATRSLINLLSTPPNGWGTAVVGVNEGTAGGILMPSAAALPFPCGDWPACLISEKYRQP